jgi:exonuclease III
MRQLAWPVGAGLALAGAFSAAAFAAGPGKYTVSGTNVKDKSEYHGTAILTQTGPMTWEVVEEIAGDTFEGFGIGDGKTIAITFAGDGSTVAALYIANSDGSYTGMWADEGDKDVSTERLQPQ